MSDNGDTLDLMKRNLHLAGLTQRPGKEPDKESPEEESCAAFGYLRGIRDHALAIEFRFRSGNRIWYPYSWLGPFQFNPSVGVLLKFTGDVTTLVLIRGSNLDMPVRDHAINLIDRGLQRHRITFVREMDEHELKRTGNREPTVDQIDIREFETVESSREWLRSAAPIFLKQAMCHP